MKRVIVLTLFLFSLLSAYSQYSKEVKRAFMDGEYFLALESYPDALEGYKKVYKVDPENANINYRMGICYLNIPGQKEKAIPYLEKAVKKTTDKYKEGNVKENKAPQDAFFFLGTAYLLQYRFEDAKTYFEKYLKYVDPTDTLDYDFVKQEIAAIERARNFMAHPVAVSLENVGKNINNTGANFDPVVSGDESTLVYVTRLKFYDAVFYTRKSNTGWSTPRNITPEIQSDGDLYPAGISFDGKTLFMSRNDRFNSDIWVSHLKDGQWTKAEKLGKNINTKYWESSATLSPDGKTLYFTSNRKGGYGGLDIYTSHFDEKVGEWGPANNLGSTINTEFNEETPFLSKDGKTLYFSSQGHNSMGNFDIFYSELQKNGTWSKPRNVGYPINSTDDDLFFVPIIAEVYGYYSMFDPVKSIGNKDIFRVEFYSDINPRPIQLTGTVHLKNKPETYNNPILIVLRNKKTGEIIKETSIAPSEKYNISARLPKGNYVLTLQANSYQQNRKEISIPEDYSVSCISEDVTLEPVPIVKAEYLPVIFFNFDKASLSDKERGKVNRLANIMKDYPELVINITGYADSKGTAGYNRRLSMRRARAVANVLKKAGISSARYNLKGAGETNFIAINHYPDGRDCPEGRALNRRVEITVVKSPVNTIKPAPINVPDQLKIK
ncbi:MAG TPA: tetratricopeptide repeat protein [Bacteroidetes bacterium]|nr:tetratricopeptide repeat protein [Bacteroidota bacterium]